MTPGAILIYAAGLGTRMGALTRDRPKPLIPVAGRALIDHALDLTAPFPKVNRVVNLHYRADQLRAHLAGRDLMLSDETALLRDTGGGLAQAHGLLGGGAVFTLNSDAVWTGPNPLATLAAAWDPARMDALLLLVPRGHATGHSGGGDFTVAQDGRLTRGPGDVYAGAQIVNSDLALAFAEPVFSLNRLWDRAVAQGRLFGALHPGGWCDVGRPENIGLAEAMLADVS